MTESPRIYLDHAATSWPKPESVYRAMDHYARVLGAPAGRGAYAEAMQVQTTIARCREKIARLMGATASERIIYSLNGTDSLNMALHGMVRAGDHVITSAAEHNSVLRPLHHLQKTKQVEVTYLPVDRSGRIDPQDVQKAVRPNTRMIALVHASNVTGVIQPVKEVGKIAREAGVFFLLDAAQTLGCLPLDVKEIGCDLLAAPGHKGLLGPLGTGVLYVGEKAFEEIVPLRQGGTGSRSDEEWQPTDWPDRLEVGNLNVPGIFGLEAGVSEVLQEGPAAIADRQQQRLASLEQKLQQVSSLVRHGPTELQNRVAIASFTLPGISPQELAALLDSAARVQVRSGIHCAPRMHQALGTSPAGTVRMSLGHSTTDEEITTAIAVLAEIAESFA